MSEANACTQDIPPAQDTPDAAVQTNTSDTPLDHHMDHASKFVWLTASGRAVPLGEMSWRHLKNLLSFLQKDELVLINKQERHRLWQKHPDLVPDYEDDSKRVDMHLLALECARLEVRRRIRQGYASRIGKAPKE